MAEGGGGRAWLFLKRNDGYAEARPPFAGGAPSFLDAPFPLRRQTEADLEAARWGLLAWENPFAAPGPCSPFWSVAPMMEVVPAPAPAGGPGLVEMAREGGASLEGLMLADGTLILKVERAGRARQLRFADGAGFDPHCGSFDYTLRYGPDWPRRNARAGELWRMLGGPAPPAGRGSGTGSFSLRLTGQRPGRRRARSPWTSGAQSGSPRTGTRAARWARRCAGASSAPAT